MSDNKLVFSPQNIISSSHKCYLKGRQRMMEREAILYWVLREGLIDEVMSKQRSFPAHKFVDSSFIGFSSN